MKTRFLATLVLSSLLMLPASAMAQSPAASPTAGKIGILNIQAAMRNTAEGKKALGDLDKKYQPKRQELQRMQQEINSMEDTLQRQTATLSDAEQARQTRQLEEKRKIFTRTQEDDQSDFGADTADTLSRLEQKMARVIQEFAEQNGYSVILDLVAPVYSSSGQIGNAQVPVYFAGKDVDVTQEIIRRYDAANPVAAEATPPPATPAAQPAPRTTTTPKPPAKPPVK
ncbi:MAG: OmpH family outer membrane protein [Terriglobia bacterium]|jgi:outer membrane protein